MVAESEQMPAIGVEDPAGMNLLGLLIARVLERRIALPRARAHARRIRGDVAVRAGDMKVTLRFAPDGVRVTRAVASAPIAVLEGSLHAFVDVATRGRLARHLRKGTLRARGRIRPLWHLAALLAGAASRTA